VEVRLLPPSGGGPLAFIPPRLAAGTAGQGGGIRVDDSGVGWWCGRMAGTGVFVGREGELSRLHSALAERARLVLVVGMPVSARPVSSVRVWPGPQRAG
jgi:hypothetical protein